MSGRKSGQQFSLGAVLGSTLKRLKGARHILVTQSLDSALPIGQSATVLKNSAGHLLT
jgi:hypothetical protein